MDKTRTKRRSKHDKVIGKENRKYSRFGKEKKGDLEKSKWIKRKWTKQEAERRVEKKRRKNKIEITKEKHKEQEEHKSTD